MISIVIIIIIIITVTILVISKKVDIKPTFYTNYAKKKKKRLTKTKNKTWKLVCEHHLKLLKHRFSKIIGHPMIRKKIHIIIKQSKQNITSKQTPHICMYTKSHNSTTILISNWLLIILRKKFKNLFNKIKTKKNMALSQNGWIVKK